MVWSEWKTTEDDYAIYKKRTNEHGIEEVFTEYKQKWFDENPPVEPEPQPPTIEEQLAARDALIEGLQQENTMLQMGLMEMTMYTASQDERLQTQENAVMELSMLVAGGGA